MTSTGRSSLLVGLALVAAGLLLGTASLTALGATLVVAVVIALVLVGRPPDLHTTRRLVPDRVTAGESSTTELTITNHGRRANSASRGLEHVGDTTVAVDIPSLDPGESVVVSHPITAERRGVFTVGPLTVRRADPIGLARRGDLDSRVSQLIVHPQIHLVTPFPAGMRRDLEGLPSGEAAEGGVTFSNLRDYVPGDDLRLVHWKSSAHVGRLVVRHNVDVHRPRTTVILDTGRARYDDESFEDAVRVAASIVASAMTRRFPFVLRTTAGAVFDERTPRLGIMDFLAALDRHDGDTDDLGTTAVKAAAGPAGLSCAVVTGRADVAALRGLGPVRSRFDRLTIVRMGTSPTSEVFDLAGALLINAGTSTDFAGAWNRRMRR